MGYRDESQSKQVRINNFNSFSRGITLCVDVGKKMVWRRRAKEILFVYLINNI